MSGPNIELLDGATGAVLQSRPLAGTSGVAIQGAPGNVDDSLTVDLSGGALALPDGIHFDGGAGGYDSLVMTGGEPAPGSYQATGPGSGVVTHAGTRVFFSNLEPVTDTIAATDFIITGTTGNNTINIVNGGSCGGGCQLTQVNSPSFESVAFAHKTNVTINGLAGADAFNLNNSAPATGLTKLVLDAGGNPGDVIGITSFNLVTGTLSLTNVISVSQSGILAVGNLAVQAAGLVNLGNLSNQVTTVAGNTTGNGANFILASSVPTLTVGTVEGIVGVTTMNGLAQIQNFPVGGTLVVSNAITTVGGAINLFAEHMTFNAALNAGSGIVYLDNETFSEPIVLGAKPANALGLNQSDFNQITAGTLRIGDETSDTGGLTVTTAIAAPAGWNTLDLRQLTNITEANFGILTVPNLVLHTGGGSVDLSNFGNHVNALAGATLGGNLSYRDVGHTTISTVGGVIGLNSAGGFIAVVAHKGGLTMDQAVLSGAGSIFLTADESVSTTDNVTVDPGVVVSSTAGDIQLEAGDQVNLGAGSMVAAGGMGNVTLVLSFGDTDGLGGGMSRDFANIVHCDRVQIMTAIGGSAPDSFGLFADAGTILHAIGGLPGSSPGDTLFVGTLGATNPTLAITSFDATGATGQWTFGNRQPVDFTGIDTFDNLNHRISLPLVRK